MSAIRLAGALQLGLQPLCNGHCSHLVLWVAKCLHTGDEKAVHDKRKRSILSDTYRNERSASFRIIHFPPNLTFYQESGKVSNLLSFDEAIETIAASVEARVPGGWEIVVYKIVSEHEEIGEFFAEKLNLPPSGRQKGKPLVKEKRSKL